MSGCPSTRANAHCERVIKTFRHEALDWLVIVGEHHLQAVLGEYLSHYNGQRPHLALDLCTPEPLARLQSGQVVRHRRLHGLISEYHRAA